jgi:UDP-N-acetylmuramoyl-tripeptide--D-alanyl-D-alanine ligase
MSSVQALNAVGTLVVVGELGLSQETAKKTISGIKPLSGRGHKIIINFKNNQESLLIDDSYNANPDSMYASLCNLYKIKSKLINYETVLIIGDMLELGKKAKLKHLELIPILKKINPNLLITVGSFTQLISKELKIKSYSYLNVDDLLSKIKEIVKPNQLILIKGSNGTNLWKLVKVLQNFNQENNNAA